MSQFPRPNSIIHKKTASLLRLRETNAVSKNRDHLNNLVLFRYTNLYNVGGNQTNIYNIIQYNPKIELYLFEIVNNKVRTKIYDGINFTNDNFYAQNVIYSDDDRGDVLHSFDLRGRLKGKKEASSSSSSKSGSRRDNIVLVNDIQAEHLYTDEFFTKFYLFSHNYYNSYTTPREVKKAEEEIYKKHLYKKHRLNLIYDNADYDKSEAIRMQDPNYKLFKYLEKHLNPSIKSSHSKHDSSDRTRSRGGSTNKTIYIKMLRNKNLLQLQKLAKNKKIKYTKKIDGKMVAIKKETLIRKLCKYKY